MFILLVSSRDVVFQILICWRDRHCRTNIVGRGLAPAALVITYFLKRREQAPALRYKNYNSPLNPNLSRDVRTISVGVGVPDDPFQR